MLKAEVKRRGKVTDLYKSVRADVKLRMKETVKLLCHEAKDIVRVRSGALRKSLKWEVLEKDGLIEGWYGSNRPWKGEASLPYAIYIELGFYHVHAKRFIGPFPYLRPPLITKAEEVKQIWRGRGIVMLPKMSLPEET